MDAKDELKKDEPPPVFEREHHTTLDGQALHYRAQARWHEIRETVPGKEGEQADHTLRGRIFAMSYTRLDVDDRLRRPLLFVVNGGPGSSSVWLHLGWLGPQRVVSDALGHCGEPPYALEANPDSLLPQADLVFIDPIGTGFSTMQTGQKTAEFHDYQRDLDALAEFIRVYLTREQRWGSPLYLLGESYGSTRSAALARQLQLQHEIHLNGVGLISLALDFQTFSFDPLNDLPYLLFLPTYAATAWYHRRLSPQRQAQALPALIAEAEAFAAGPYASALLQGDRLPPAQAQALAAQIADLCGLSESFVQRCRLRVNDERFFKELLRDQGLAVGRLDSRFTGRDADDAGEKVEDDASYSAMAGAFRVGIQRVLAEQFGWQGEAPYRLLAPLYQSWRYSQHENRYLATGPLLRDALHRDPALRVFIASGLYDLATPHAAAEHSLAHLGLRGDARSRIELHRAEAGHMMYLLQPARQTLSAALRRFVRPC